MATKWKDDIWSIAAVVIGLFSLLYCLSFIIEFMFHSTSADLLASLRKLSKGDA